MEEENNKAIKKSGELKYTIEANKISKILIFVFLAGYFIFGFFAVRQIDNYKNSMTFSMIAAYSMRFSIISLIIFLGTKIVINRNKKQKSIEEYSINDSKELRFAKKAKKILKKLTIFFAIMLVIDMIAADLASGWDGVGYAIFAMLNLFAFVITLISYGAAKLMPDHYEIPTSKKTISSLVMSILALVGSIWLVVLIMSIFESSFDNQTLAGFNYTGYYTLMIISIIVFCVPSIILIYMSIRNWPPVNKIEKFVKDNKSTIGYGSLILASLAIFIVILINTLTNKSTIVKVDYDTLPTLQFFEAQLVKRNLKTYSTYYSDDHVVAYEKDYEYEREPSSINDKDAKYPIFIYSHYIANVGEGKTITWDIYCVNGFFYATVDELYEDGRFSGNNIFFTKYGRVVSEDDKLMTYNWKKNHFAYGGGVHNTKPFNSYYVRHMPTMMDDNCKSKCAKVIKVDRVDADTLTRISVELYKEIKNENYF